MGTCACWEGLDIVEIKTVVHVEGPNVEVEWTCPCCQGLEVLTAVVDVEHVADSALLLLSTRDRGELVREMETQGHEDVMSSIAEAAIELIRRRITDPLRRDVFSRLTFGELDAAGCVRVARALRAEAHRETCRWHKQDLGRAARCLLVAADAADDEQIELAAEAEGERRAA